MQLGRVFGLLCLFIGGLFIWLNTSMSQDAGFTLKMFKAGPGFIGLGLALLVLPGGDITAAQSRNKEKDPKTWMTEAPMMHKVIWGVAFLAGIVVYSQLIK